MDIGICLYPIVRDKFNTYYINLREVIIMKDNRETNSSESPNTLSSDKLLIIYLCIFSIVTITSFGIEKLVVNWYEGPTKYIRSSLWIFSDLSMILIPLSIRNKSLKIVGLIITTIMVIYFIYGNISYMIG